MSGRCDLTVALVEITAEQLNQRREELLAALPFDEEELFKRAADDHTASPDEREIYNELVEIDFLLGK
ncbi:hypothetical protein HUO13_12740 [Saccharopolyspora erythraea]|uniref:hypothetical protein n=1 Tax=Saccharopolyspora erythraea TaxID=1836 RepID=UPI001BA85745|nr:hypothetical protein [Saccharopolyspora erythraea]QUH01561.1 hypothetical protein HUO13_12740 [Saccharopolyspora erythraea]